MKTGPSAKGGPVLLQLTGFGLGGVAETESPERTPRRYANGYILGPWAQP
jgi:hypothetical protein